MGSRDSFKVTKSRKACNIKPKLTTIFENIPSSFRYGPIVPHPTPRVIKIIGLNVYLSPAGTLTLLTNKILLILCLLLTGTALLSSIPLFVANPMD